jgi:hypothetical protein
VVHAAAGCGSSIRYARSTADGGWLTATFAHPSHFVDQAPQLAVDGNRLYLAWTRGGGEGCGPHGDTGIRYRWRTLPDGPWSAPIAIGLSTDKLDSFRVAGGVIEFIAAPDDSDVRVLVRVDQAGEHRHALPGGTSGPASLRIGSDGRARVVYETFGGLRYGIEAAGGIASSHIPGTTGDDQHPSLVLDGTNHAYVVWTREPPPGCVTREPEPADGTYFATNASGSWTPTVDRRFTGIQGPTALTLDLALGRVHVLVGGAAVTYFARSPTGSWSSATLARVFADSVSIRLDQSTGALTALYSREQEDNISASVFAFTKP